MNIEPKTRKTARGEPRELGLEFIWIYGRIFDKFNYNSQFEANIHRKMGSDSWSTSKVDFPLSAGGWLLEILGNRVGCEITSDELKAKSSPSRRYRLCRLSYSFFFNCESKSIIPDLDARRKRLLLSRLGQIESLLGAVIYSVSAEKITRVNSVSEIEFFSSLWTEIQI